MLTNVQFTKEDTRFKYACEIVRQNLPNYTEFRPSTRQASKFRRERELLTEIMLVIFLWRFEHESN